MSSVFFLVSRSSFNISFNISRTACISASSLFFIFTTYTHAAGQMPIAMNIARISSPSPSFFRLSISTCGVHIYLFMYFSFRKLRAVSSQIVLAYQRHPALSRLIRSYPGFHQLIFVYFLIMPFPPVYLPNHPVLLRCVEFPVHFRREVDLESHLYRGLSPRTAPDLMSLCPGLSGIIATPFRLVLITVVQKLLFLLCRLRERAVSII